MDFREALKEYRESKGDQASTSSSNSSTSPQTTTASSGNGTSGTSFRDMLNAYRSEKASTISLDMWADASLKLIDDVANNSDSWYDENEYQDRYNRFVSVLGQASNWRNQYAGNSDAIDYIDSVVSALEEAKRYNFNNRKYFSQWGNEDDYNAYVTKQADEAAAYDAMVNFDLDSGDREIRRLNAILDEYRQLSRFIQDSRGEARLAEIRNKYGEEADIQALISQKKQYLNQARRIQEGVKFSGVADPDSQFYDPEFKTYSGYVSTKSDAPLGRLVSQYGLGYDDLTYEYINNPDGIRDVIDQKTRVYGSSKYKENVYEEKGYSYMTQAEVAIYNYYYAKDGKEKAEQYLDSIQETLNYRKANSMYANLEDNTALEIAFGFAAGTDQFASGMKNLFNTDDDYIPTSAIQMAAGMVREDLADDSIPVWYNFADKKWEDKVFGQSVGQMGYDAVSTSANMLPSIMASMAVGMINPLAGKAVGSTLMGASAAGNAYQEMLNLGYDKGQARTYSTLVGASEAGLQYLLGGVGKLGGTLSGNVIAKAMNGVDNAFLRFAIEFAGNMASEGLEEGLQEILTPWLQNLVMHTDEDVNWSEVAYSTLLGALTAGVMEGPSTISAGVSTTRTGAQLRNAGISAERLADLGKTFAADTAAAQIAGRVNENTGAYTMGRLFNEIGATLTEQNMNDITNALIKEGIDRDIAEKNAEALAAVVEGANLTDRQVKIIEANETLAKAVRTTIIDPNATWFQRTKGYNEALMALAQEKSSKAKQASPEQGNAPGSDNVDAQNKNGAEGGYGVEGIDTSPVKVKSISAIKNGKAIIKLDDGTEVDVREADVDPDDGVRIETIAGIDGISASDASYILGTLKATPGASAQMDSLGAVEAYKYGFYGFSQDHIAKHGVFANALSESQRNAIYATGQKARQQQMENATPKKSGGASLQTGIYFDAGGGNVTAFNSVKKTLTEKQTAGVRAAQVLRKLGIGGDIYFFESYRNSKNQLVYKDKNGKEVAAPNGWYSEKDGSIHIDLNAGKGGNGFVLFTMAHELTHFIEQWSPQKYKVLADFLVENYEKGQSMDKLVRAKQEKLSKLRGKPVSYNEAYSEVIADSMEAMLADGNVLDKLIELKAKDNSLFMKMKQFFDNLVAKIRRIYEGQTPDSAEGQAVLEMKDSIEQIQQLFAEALVEASDNFRSAAESVVEPNSKPVAAEEILTDGAVVTDGEGNKYSIRSMKHDIAEGQMFEDLKTYCNWTQKQVDELRKNLSDLVAYMTPFRDILDMNETYDREGRRFSPYKPNSDPLYTISMDFSTLCSKRLLTQYVIENLQLRENRPMSAEEQMAIRDMLNEYRKVEKGLQVACAMCYVEAARLKSPKQITKWMTDPETQMRNYFADKNPEFAAYIKEKQADFKEARGYPRNAKKKDMSAKDVRELNKIRPRLRTQYEISEAEAKIIERAKALPNSTYLTAGNLAALSESDPTIYAAYTAFVRTATRSKSLETDEPYYYGDSTRDNGNGIIVSDSFIESVNRENGMRFSSWSDWRIQHLLDFITAVIDNSVRGAAMHGYTKFGDEVRVLGKTGMMFNMSGVAGTQTGLNEDGSLSFSPTESIDVDEAIQLREEFPETAGLQCIGVGDDHIVALLRSDIIDYVIPYHTSGLNAALRRMANIHGWKDYTTTQHAAIDKSIKFENAVDKEHWHEEPVYSEFFVGYDTGMTGIEAMRESADRYVQMCKDRGLKPKFEQFVKEDNYWKLLIDRKMVNQKTGKLIQQKPVTPTFDFATVKSVVDKYVQNYDSGLEARALNHIVENWDSIPKRIRDLKKQGGTKAKKASKAVDILANQTLAAQPTAKLSDREFDLENESAKRYSSRYEERFFPGNVFPSGKTHTDITNWANRKDVKVGDNRLVFYREAYYRVQKFDSMDFGYQITKKFTAQNYEEVQKEYVENDSREPVQSGFNEIVTRSGETAEYGQGGYYADSSESGYGREDNRLRKMDAGQHGWREDPGQTERDRPSGLYDQRHPRLEWTPQELYDKILDLDRKSARATGRYATKLKNQSERYARMIDEMNGWDEVKLSDRDTDSVSNRSLLANALESAAQNDIERKRIQEYKSKIDLINAEEQQLSSLNEQIRELATAKGPKDTKKIRSLQFEAQIAANRINTYDKQLLRLEASKPLQTILDREKKMAYQRAEQKGKAALAAYREEATKTQRELMDRYQESRKKGIENRNRTAMRHKIKDIVNELNQYLLKGTKDRHVPIGLQKAVAEALNAVNMDTVGADERLAKLQVELVKAKTPEAVQEIAKKFDHVREMGGRMDEKLKKLKAAYDEIINSDDPLIANAHDDGLSAHMMTLIVRVGDTALRDMSLSQLQDVYDVYKIVLATVRNANKSFKDNKNRDISTRASQVMAEIDALGIKRGKRLPFMNWVEKFGWDNLKPVYAMEHIGSKGLIDAFNNVRSGEDTWAKDVTEAREYYLERFKKYHYDSWDFEKKSRFTSTTGKNFELTLDQIMSLYAYSKRDQAADHLKYGGIVFDPKTEVVEKTKFGIKVKYNVATATSYNISEETLADIIGKLTPEQKAFVDEMQAYLSDVMGAKGNEVSLAMYDVKLFREKNYFPLKSAHQYMAKAKEQAQGDVKIKNSGFSKETKPHAKNPIVLSSFMDVWSNHVNEMSMYHAFVLPMEDFYRIYNYTTPSKNENMPTEGVNAYIENAYGSGATGYIEQMLNDLNGGARADSRTGFINKAMGMFKKGAVFASASVVVQQPSAIARAAALLDLKYFIGPKVDHKRHKLLWNEVKQYAPVAVIKEMGYFDTNMGKSTEDFIMGQEYSTITEKAKALVADSDYRDEVLSKAPALADEIAWCAIWEAVKRETIAKNSGMDVKSNAFLKKAGERFTEVIVKTQVYDSVLSRSANMRSKDTGMKMATSFMAEPTTAINMVADALLKAKRGDKKSSRKAIGSVIAAQFLNAFLVSWVYAARDDDEDETYWEKYISSFVSSLKDGINPATYIPFIKDIVSIVKGYDVERSDMAVIKDLWDAWQQLKKDDVSAWRKVEGFVGSICQIFGLPVKNIMRDVRAVWQVYNTAVNGETSTATGIKYAIAEGVTGGTIPDTRQLYYARRDGDSEHAARVAARYDDEDSANAAVRSAIREMYLADEIDLLTARNHLIAYGGMDVDDAHWQMDEWKYRKDNGSDEGYNKYNNLYEAVRTGENLETVIQAYIENGVKKSTLAGQLTEHFKPQYLAMSESERSKFSPYLTEAFELCGSDTEDVEKKLWNWEFEDKYGFAWSDRKQAYLDGEVSASELRPILVEVGGYSREDADAQIEAYEWEADGIEGATVAAVKNYNTWCEPAGVSREHYMQIRTFSNNTENDVDENGKSISYSAVRKIMAEIDRLPISASKKTALAYSCGWKEKTIEKYKLW